MTFQQQLDRIQALIQQYNKFVPATRQMGPYLVHDLDFYINGVRLYCCVNYTKQEVIWRNKDTGEEVRF